VRVGKRSKASLQAAARRGGDKVARLKADNAELRRRLDALSTAPVAADAVEAKRAVVEKLCADVGGGLADTVALLTETAEEILRVGEALGKMQMPPDAVATLDAEADADRVRLISERDAAFVSRDEAFAELAGARGDQMALKRAIDVGVMPLWLVREAHKTRLHERLLLLDEAMTAQDRKLLRRVLRMAAEGVDDGAI